MRSFMEEQDKFALHLRPAEILHLVAEKRPDLSEEKNVESALQQLCEWGNLERHQDTSDVKTVEEFYRTRYLYQLTREGEEAERAIARYLAALVDGGELQTAALGDIRKLLGELILLAQSEPIDEDKTFGAFSQLRNRFEELTSRAQTFMSSLQRSIDQRETQEEPGLIRYKEVLIQYLQKFILDLRTSGTEIAERITALESEGLGRILQAVATRELTDSLEKSEEIQKRIAAEWETRWHGLRLWFLGDGRRQPRAEVLRRKALSAITQVLSAISRLNDRRVSRTDRIADLRTLARWFAEADTDAEAHRLWMAAFGLTPSRHLTVDAESLAEREARPVRPQTGWADAPTLRITPRLRLTGHYSRKGAGKAVVDRSQEKAYLAAIVQEEAKQLEAARADLATRGRTRLSGLGPLSTPSFNLFLELLGDALTARTEEGQQIEVRSTDGTLLIELTPTGDGREACIETTSGLFRGPDHFLWIRSDDPETYKAPTSSLTQRTHV